MKIYKYQSINDYFWKNLIKNELWFNNPLDFNDYYDSNLPLNFNYTPEEIELFFKRSCDLNDKTQREYEDFIRENKLHIDNLSANKSEKEKFFKITFEDHIKNRIGISCFSKTGVNDYLWGIYAENNKGICLEFDTEKDKEYFKNLYEVVYKDKLPIIKPRLQYLSGDFKELFTTKKTCWQQEEEIRLFRHGTRSDKYNPHSLTKIIFGIKTNIKSINKVIAICLQKNKNITFDKIENLKGNFVLKVF